MSSLYIQTQIECVDVNLPDCLVTVSFPFLVAVVVLVGHMLGPIQLIRESNELNLSERVKRC